MTSISIPIAVVPNSRKPELMSLSKSPNRVPPSPPKLLEDGKQGIVAILGEERTVNPAASPIRRTLSADMSSKNWLHQNGFCSQMKKSEEECERAPSQDDVWRKIQEQKSNKIDTWGSLIATKQSDNENDNNCVLPPPYVHPLVKRSASALSEKSLEICTESLGSETGSDCFSGYSSSEIATDDEKEYTNRGVQSYLHGTKCKKSPAQSLPPPLTALYMHSRRENGRLVLEAVEVTPRKYFDARRRNGRLVLNLINGAPAVDPEKREIEEEEWVDDGGGAAAENSVVVKILNPASGVISVATKSGLVVKKLIAIGNPNPKLWADAEEDHRPIPQKSLPPPPPRVARLINPPPPLVGAAAASFNVYEYKFWRSRAHSKTLKANVSHSNPKGSDPPQDSLVQNLPYLKGCKEPRRSLPFWELNCIATT